MYILPELSMHINVATDCPRSPFGSQDVRTFGPPAMEATRQIPGSVDSLTMPLEALQLSWLLYEPNWKAFAGLTLVMAVLLVQGMCLFRSTSQVLRKMEAQVRSLQESLEALPHHQEAAGPALLDKDLDAGPWMTKMEGIQGHIETVSQQVRALQAEIKMEKALEELRTLHEALETTRGMLKEMESQKSDESVKMQQLQVNVTESTDRLKQFHEAFTKSHLVSTMKMLATKAESEDLEKLSKLVQSELLKTMQQFAAAETLMDSILKQGRESLSATQQDLKNLTEKAVVLESGMERSLNLHKTLSNELHVCKTVLEQKVDKLLKGLQDHQGWCQSSFRPLFPLVPSLKYIGDSTKDGMGYHVSHNQQLTHLETLVTEVRTTVQALGDVCESLEAHIGRVESTSMGALDAVNEQSEQILNMQRETPQLLDQVLERLPKLPLRKPPTEASQTSAPATSSQEAPQQQQPAQQVPQHVHQVPVQPPQTIELRPAGEHMPVSLPQRQPGPIYMLPGQPQQQQTAPPRVVQVSRDDLIQAFLGGQ